MKKFLAVLVALILCVGLLAGCAGGEDEAGAPDTDENPPEGQTPNENGEEDAEKPQELSDETITVAIASEPNTLVPGVNFLGNTYATILRLIYEPLIVEDYKTSEFFDTGLAIGWDSIDELSFKLTIREGVKFHNGEELTVNDIYYLIEQGAQGGMADYFGIFDLPNCTIENDYNIILTTTEPWAQAKELLGYMFYLIPSKTALEAAGGAGVTSQYLEKAGTGKYVFEQWTPGRNITLVRNEDYWDQENMGYFAGFEFVFISDSTARAMAVQSGDADVATECSVSDYELYNSDDTIQAELLEVNNPSVIYLNSGKGGPCADVRVREAIYWLVDKNALKDVGNSGFGKLCDTIISPDSPMWDGIDESTDKIVDVERAKELLAEAGYGDGLTLKLRSSSSTPVVTMLQEQLRQGGIDLQIELAETAVHFAALGEGDYDLYVSNVKFAYYTEGVRCTDGLRFDYSDVLGGCGYKNEEYSEICARCYSTVDIDERKEAYADLQQYFRENFVSIGLYTSVSLTVTRPDVQGIGLFDAVTDLSNVYCA